MYVSVIVGDKNRGIDIEGEQAENTGQILQTMIGYFKFLNADFL